MKHRLLYGVCIMVLVSLVACGSENGLYSMESESALAIESSNKSVEGDERTTIDIENSFQTVYSATIERQVYLPEEDNLSTYVLDTKGLYAFLSGLSYSNETCDGLPEYIIHFDDGSQYCVNITEGWIWRGNNKEAKLTGEEMALINSFIQ